MHYFLFFTRLVVHFLRFLLHYLLYNLKPYKLFLFSSIVMVGFSLLLLLAVLTIPPVPQVKIVNKDISGVPTFTQDLTQSQAEEQLEYWVSLTKKYPDHRDVLINTALLYLALGNQRDAEYYWQQAKKIDPNHHFFKENSL